MVLGMVLISQQVLASQTKTHLGEACFKSETVTGPNKQKWIIAAHGPHVI